MKNLRRLGQNGCTVLPKLFLFIFKAMKSSEHFISEDNTVNITLKKFAGNVVAVELDEDDGRYVYEIEIISGGKEAEFEIDAKTGK